MSFERDILNPQRFMAFFDTIFDFLFPKRCFGCRKENEYICLSCLSTIERISPNQSLQKGNTQSLFDYRNKIIRKTLWKLKYSGVKDISDTLGKLLYEKILLELSEEKEFRNVGKIILIPIPLHKKKLQERGFNQAELLVQSIIRNDTERIFLYYPDLLIKNRATKSQMMIKNKAERLSNLSGSFLVNDKNKIKDNYVIIVDDITTTGATIKEVTRVLEENGVKNVTAFTVAH